MCEEVPCVDCVPCQLPACPVLLQAERSVAAQYVYMLAMFSSTQQLYCILYLIACGGIVAI